MIVINVFRFSNSSSDPQKKSNATWGRDLRLKDPQQGRLKPERRWVQICAQKKKTTKT